MKRILVVDPDSAYRARLQESLQTLPCEVVALDSPQAAVHAMRKQPTSMVITGSSEPVPGDLELLRAAQQGSQPVPVLVLACSGTTRGAIDYMGAGAYDYLAKPTDPRELCAVVEEILRHSGEEESPLPSSDGQADEGPSGDIVGRSPEMIEIFKLIGRIAKSDAVVLIQGESGTGKELVARAIHDNSRRAGKPFLAVNCAAIPETLLESELFGHEKGAFTGAAGSRRGKFELSHGGTIFLDEVGDMSLVTQAKILRVLQEHTFERVGGEQTLYADARIIAATNKSLVELIERSEFRVDLFYRLKVVSIFLPALRKRPGDLPLLVDHFLKKYGTEAKLPIRGISRRARALLEAQTWTGNVRELENAIQTAVVLNRTGRLDCEDFPFLARAAAGAPERTAEGAVERLGEEARRAAQVLLAHQSRPGDGSPFYRSVDVVERAVVDTALEFHGGNQVRASRALGISRNTLRSKMSPRVDTERPPP